MGLPGIEHAPKRASGIEGSYDLLFKVNTLSLIC